MAIQVQDVVNSARAILLDPVPTTWLDASFALWLNDVLSAASTLKRDINPQIVSIPLVAGAVQDLVTSTPLAIQFMEPYSNTASGNGVNPVGMQLLNRRVPSWRTMTATVDVTDAMNDERAPTKFHVYPPNTGSGALTCLIGVTPFVTVTLPLNACTVVIPIPDNYRMAIVCGLVSRALSAQTRRQDIMKANAFWQAFEGLILGSKVAIPEVTPIVSEKTEA